MREIKFRAWDKKEKKWTLPVIVYSGNTTLIEPYKYRKDTKGNLIEVELIQYTGLKDKNGKEIYEGDIVIGKVNYQGKDLIIKGAIEWLDRIPAFILHDIYQIRTTGFTLGVINKLKIIGNIYENPELLKED